MKVKREHKGKSTILADINKELRCALSVNCKMEFQVKIAESGRKNIVRIKQKRNKIPLVLLHVKLLRER